MIKHNSDGNRKFKLLVLNLLLQIILYSNSSLAIVNYDSTNFLYTKAVNTVEINDLAKNNLKGSVKSVELYNSKDQLISQMNFNESGHYDFIKFEDKNTMSDELFERLEQTCFPKKILEDFNVVHPFGYGIKFCENYPISFYTNTINYEYNNNKLINIIFDINTRGSGKISFKYNDDNTLNTADLYASDFGQPEHLVSKLKYKWSNKKLIQKTVYRVDGSATNDYRITYDGNKIYVVNILGDNSTHYINLNFQNNIIEENKVESDVSQNKFSITNYYDYENNLLTKIIKNSTPIDNHSFYNSSKSKDILFNYIFKRDKYGNITQIKNQFYNDKEWEYKYDSYGNWIERTEYLVHDLKIEKAKFKRIITYY